MLVHLTFSWLLGHPKRSFLTVCLQLLAEIKMAVSTSSSSLKPAWKAVKPMPTKRVYSSPVSCAGQVKQYGLWTLLLIKQIITNI